MVLAASAATGSGVYFLLRANDDRGSTSAASSAAPRSSAAKNDKPLASATSTDGKMRFDLAEVQRGRTIKSPGGTVAEGLDVVVVRITNLDSKVITYAPDQEKGTQGLDSQGNSLSADFLGTMYSGPGDSFRVNILTLLPQQTDTATLAFKPTGDSVLASVTFATPAGGTAKIDLPIG